LQILIQKEIGEKSYDLTPDRDTGCVLLSSALLLALVQGVILKTVLVLTINTLTYFIEIFFIMTYDSRNQINLRLQVIRK
jgi:hypothetical protein